MKKIKITFVAVILLAFAQHAGMACSGDHWVTGNITDFAVDFFNNCCAGSQVTVLDIRTGTTVTLSTQMNGVNSSCISEG